MPMTGIPAAFSFRTTPARSPEIGEHQRDTGVQRLEIGDDRRVGEEVREAGRIQLARERQTWSCQARHECHRRISRSGADVTDRIGPIELRCSSAARRSWTTGSMHYQCRAG
jgi:hypothetical protein